MEGKKYNRKKGKKYNGKEIKRIERRKNNGDKNYTMKKII